MTPEIVLKPEAGYDVGFGHAYRLMALVEYLKEEFSCQLHCQAAPPELKKTFTRKRIDFLEFSTEREQVLWLEQNPGRVLVLDGYHFSEVELTAFNKLCRKIVKIDDLFETHPSYDVIVNHSPSASADHYSSKNHRFALGSDYLMVRKAFLQERAPRICAAPPARILICFGATDPNNVADRVLKALSECSCIKEVHVLSASRKDFETSAGVALHRNLDEDEIIQLMRFCDLAICPPSTISLEACCVGLPLILFQTATNQSAILEGLDRTRSAVTLALDDLESTLPHTIGRLSLKDMQQMISNQGILIDRKSDTRFRELFRNL